MTALQESSLLFPVDGPCRFCFPPRLRLAHHKSATGLEDVAWKKTLIYDLHASAGMILAARTLLEDLDTRDGMSCVVRHISAPAALTMDAEPRGDGSSVSFLIQEQSRKRPAERSRQSAFMDAELLPRADRIHSDIDFLCFIRWKV